MTISMLNLRCQKCEHEWTEMFEMGVTVESFLAKLKGVNICPECNHKRIDIVTGEKRQVSVTIKGEVKP